MTKEGMGDEAMKKSLFYRAKKMPPSAQIMLLFAVEGVFLQYITSINGFGLNLYATNMGATDSQIGIIQMVPNIVAYAALLPLGILADRLKSTKTIPMLTLLVMCAGYAFLGSVPALGERCMELFFVSLAFTAGALAIYNAQWQAMFGAAVSLRQRNDVYAFRNQPHGRWKTSGTPKLLLSVCCLCFVAGRCNQKNSGGTAGGGKSSGRSGEGILTFFCF